MKSSHTTTWTCYIVLYFILICICWCNKCILNTIIYCCLSVVDSVYAAIKQHQRHRRHRKHRVIGPCGREGQTDHYAAVYTLYAVRPPRGKRLTVRGDGPRSSRPSGFYIFFCAAVVSGRPVIQPSVVQTTTLCDTRRLLI